MSPVGGPPGGAAAGADLRHGDHRPSTRHRSRSRSLSRRHQPQQRRPQAPRHHPQQQPAMVLRTFASADDAGQSMDGGRRQLQRGQEEGWLGGSASADIRAIGAAGVEGLLSAHEANGEVLRGNDVQIARVRRGLGHPTYSRLLGPRNGGGSRATSRFTPDTLQRPPHTLPLPSTRCYAHDAQVFVPQVSPRLAAAAAAVPPAPYFFRPPSPNASRGGSVSPPPPSLRVDTPASPACSARRHVSAASLPASPVRHLRSARLSPPPPPGWSVHNSHHFR